MQRRQKGSSRPPGARLGKVFSEGLTLDGLEQKEKEDANGKTEKGYVGRAEGGAD